jgi:predicted nucleotidyltransferase
MLGDPGILAHTLRVVQRAALDRLVALTRALLGARLERIALFGSRARGDAEEDSDIDLLVLVRDEPTAGDRTRLSALAADLAVETRAFLPFSLILMSRARFDELLARERRFARDVQREGIVL